jgi:serpin B
MRRAWILALPAAACVAPARDGAAVRADAKVVAPALAGAAARADDQDADRKIVAAAEGALALDLFGRLPAEGNLFYSPESISVALGMTALGAKGKTLEAFEKVLHVPAALGAERFHAALGARPAEEGEGFALRSANRLFGQRGFPFEAAFKDSVAKRYGGGLEEVDFKTDTDGAREAINGWVSKETEEKIPELLQPGTPPADSRLVLVNAVYFKAIWEGQFEERWTKDGPFHVSAEKRVTARFMHNLGYRDYAEDESCQLVALPYQGRQFEAVFLLPKKDVSTLAKGLAIEKLDGLRAKAKTKLVSVSIPRFRFEWGKDLASDLRALGLEPAFSREADFSGIASSPQEPLYVGAVIHKAIVAIDEAGTEAAAATAVEMRAAGPPLESVGFKADRPFLFLIRNTQTGAILFFGRVADPTAH